ncbi:MAG: DUF5302 domain-containing protein [Actinomycetes bacterium]
MPEEKSSKPSNQDAKAKMLEALAKKQKGSSAGKAGGPVASSKIGSEAGANAPKMFRRKSGSA